VKEKYLYRGTVLANAAGSFDSMQLSKAEVEDDQVRLSGREQHWLGKIYL